MSESVFPYYSSGQTPQYLNNVVKGCLTVFSMKFSQNTEIFTADSNQINEIIDEYDSESSMSLLSVLLDFYSVILEENIKDSPDLSIRFLYSAGFFAEQLRDDAISVLNKGNLAIKNVLQLINTYQELENIFYNAIGYFFMNISIFYSDIDISRDKDNTFTHYIAESIKYFNYAFENGKPWISFFAQFLANTMHSIKEETVFNDKTVQIFFDIIDRIKIIVADENKSRIDYDDFIETIFTIINTVGVPLDLRFEAFSILSEIPGTNTVAKEKKFSKIGMDKISTFIIKYVDDLQLNRLHMHKKLAKEVVSNLTRVPLKSGTMIDNTFDGESVSLIDYTKPVIDPPEEFNKLVPKDFCKIVEAIDILSETNPDTQPLHTTLKILIKTRSNSLRSNNYKQAVFIGYWVYYVFDKDINEVVKFLIKTKLFETLLYFVIYACYDEMYERLILSLSYVCWEKVQRPETIKSIFHKFEESLYSLSCDNLIFQYFAAAIIELPVQSLYYLAPKMFEKNCAKMLVFFQTLHVNAIEKNVTYIIPYICQMRQFSCTFINLLLDKPNFLRHLSKESNFIDAVIQLTYEKPMRNISMGFIKKIISFTNIPSASLDIIFKYFHNVLSTNECEKYNEMVENIIETITECININPAKIMDQILTRNIIVDFVSFIMKSKSTLLINPLMNLIKESSKVNGSIRARVYNYNIFNKILPVVEILNSAKETNSFILHLWTIVFEDNLEPNEIHNIKNSTPLSLIFMLSKKNDDDLYKFTNYLYRCCKADLKSALEVNESDLPTCIIGEVTKYRQRSEPSKLLTMLIDLFAFLSSYSMNSNDLLTYMQCFTPLKDNFKPYFIHDLLRGLLNILKSQCDMPTLLFHLSGKNTVIELPKTKNAFNFEELTFFINVKFEEEYEDGNYEFFTMSCDGGVTLTLFINRKRMDYEVKIGKTITKGSFNHEFPSKVWIHITLTYANNKLSLYSNGKFESESRIPSISFTGNLSSVRLVKEIPCNVYNFGLIQKSLSLELIQKLAALPKSTVCTFSQSEASYLPIDCQELAQGTIYLNSIYLYNAGVAREGLPINFAPNCMEGEMNFNGQVIAFSPPGKIIFSSVGGPSVLLPLLAQLEQPMKPKEGEEIKYEIDPDSLFYIIQALTFYIHDSYPNQVSFYENHCTEIVAFLLAMIKSKHFTESTIDALKNFLDEVTYQPLALQVFEVIFLNFGIWLYQPRNIQQKVINAMIFYFNEFSSKMEKYFIKHLAMKKFFFVMKIFLWSEVTDPSICLYKKPKLDIITKEVDVERPEDVAPIRASFAKVISEYAKHSFTKSDTTTLYTLALDTSDITLSVDFLSILTDLIRSNIGPLIAELKQNYSYESFYKLIIFNDARTHAQCIHLLMAIAKLDKDAQNKLLNTFTISDYISALMITIKFAENSLIFSDVIFSYLFKTPEYTMLVPTERLSQQPISTRYKLNHVELLPIAVMSLTYLPQNTCFNIMMILEASLIQQSSKVLKIKDWDIPFIMFLMQKTPNPNENTIIDTNSNICLRILSNLYFQSIIKSNDLTYFNRIPTVCYMISQKCEGEYTHITRMLLTSFLTFIVMKEESRSKLTDSNVYGIFKLIFEYLFFIPDSSPYYVPFSERKMNDPLTFQEIYRFYLKENCPKINFTYGTKTSFTNQVWEDADLADKLLDAIEQEPTLFTPAAKLFSTTKFPNTWLVYALTLSVGLQHPSQFTTFVKHIRCLTSQIPTNGNLSTLERQSLVIYMSGIIKIYMATDRTHQSHIYLQEDATSFSNIISKMYNTKIHWGSSIDSFDSCFKDPNSGHHFAYQILEEFAMIEDSLFDYAKSVDKSSQKVISQMSHATVKFMERIKKLESAITSKHYEESIGTINSKISQYAVGIKNRLYHGSKLYSKLIQELSSDNGPWCSPDIVKDHHYRVSNSVLHNGRRHLLVENMHYTNHRDASNKRDNIEDEQEINDNLKKRIPTFTDAQPVITYNADINTDIDNIILKIDAKLVTMKNVTSGSFIITPVSIVFESSESSKSILIENDLIKYVFFRRYLLIDSAIEVFTKRNKAYFVDFAEGQRQTVINCLCKLHIKNAFIQTKEEETLQLIKQEQNKWVNGEISNFSYIMRVNILSGRTYNDLSQYPIFPWVIQDYTSEELNLSDPKVYRDLKKPIAAYGEERLMNANEKMNDSDSEGMRYQHASFYSNSAYVIGFLIRVEPFTSLHIELHSGKFDLPERLFSSIPETWNSVISIHMDFRELIPEFFYFPDFLVNKNDLDLGKESISDVALPKWAKSPTDFITKNRKALESKYVSSNLQYWMDMIFGITSRGEKSLEIDNLFNPIFFEENLTPDVLNDPDQKQFVQEYVACFGHGTHQVFTQGPHPMKETIIKEFNPRFGYYRLLFNKKDCSIIYLDVVDSSIIAITSALSVFKYNIDTSETSVTQYPSISIPKEDDIAKIIPTVSSYQNTILTAMPWDCSFVVSKLDAVVTNLHTVRSHTKRVTATSMSENYYVTGSADCTAFIWNNNPSVQQVPISIILRHKAPIVAVSVNNRNDVAVTCSSDGVIVTTELSCGQNLRMIKLNGVPKFCKILDSGLIIIALEVENSTIIKLYDINLSFITEAVHKSPIECMNTFNWSDGNYFAVIASKRKRIGIIKIPSFEEIWNEKAYDFTINSICFVKKTNMLALGTSDGRVMQLRLLFSK